VKLYMRAGVLVRSHFLIGNLHDVDIKAFSDTPDTGRCKAVVVILSLLYSAVNCCRR